MPANIFLGREMKHRYLGGLVNTLDDRQMLGESEAALAALEIHFPSLTQPIESLSGGQRQAVAIARAIYWEARLMIMDEPTNNLGVPEQHKVLELIRRLRDQGVPVILITHTLPDVFAVADRHRGHAPRAQGHREADRRHQRRGAGAVHGRGAGRHAGGLIDRRPGVRHSGGQADVTGRLCENPAICQASLGDPETAQRQTALTGFDP